MMAVSLTELSIVLAGNPNAGKTTIFNQLTGSNHHVGNYPGVTVEIKEGDCRHKDCSVHIVDLPGTYSLTISSEEEKVARDYLINESPDVVVQVVDAASLERNLYLTVQLLELEQNVVIALNMMDVAEKKGLAIDIHLLSELLDVPIVETVGAAGRGLDALMEAVVSAADSSGLDRVSSVRYGSDLDRELKTIENALGGLFDESGKPLIPSLPLKTWVAIKLLEHDELVRHDVESSDSGNEILSVVTAAAERLEKLYGDPAEIVIADKRYGFISGACQEAVKLTVESRHRFSDRVDDILAHRILGLPIFFAIIYFIFWMTFTLGEVPMGWIESGVHHVGMWVSSFWPRGSDSVIRSLLVDGIISGVGGVLVFLPNIVLLFLGISFLEDTGYIARAAFLTDWMMHKIGLHGRSFIPLIIGFGCTVPAIMATRTLESRRDRLTTMLVLPLMSCSARFPIYTLIIPAFFPPRWQAPMLWFIYLLGVVLAVIIARLLRHTLFSGAATPFVMELPIYRMPTFRGLFFHLWLRAKGYLHKAGTVILGASVFMWLIQTYPALPQAEQDRLNELAAARTAYVTELQSLGKDVSEFLIGELEFSEAESKYYSYEPEYISAGEVFTAIKSKLLEDGKKNNRLRNFLLVRDELITIDRRYKDLLNEPVGVVAAVVRQSELEKLEAAYGDTYAAAYRYLYTILKNYRKAITQIEVKCASRKLDHSFAGRIGSALEPVLKPIGFDRRLATSLIGAFAAKEMFVAQMAIVASVNTEEDGVASLRTWMREHYSPLTGLNLLIFSLIATPCMATVAVMRRESGSWKWAALQLGGLTMLAYIICLVVYQSASAAGFLLN